MISKTVKLTQALVQRESITPNDAGCLEIIAARLEKVGFQIQFVKIEDVTNLWAYHPSIDKDAKLLCFAGHTDVVPTGPVEQWKHAPFSGEIIDGILHGRGSADMKGGLAAMITAVEAYLTETPQTKHHLAFLLTSDEEGIAQHGTKAMMPWLKARGLAIDYCIIGEPSSAETIGDVVRIGRRGSLTGYVTIHGKQGHVAYPDLADNAISASLSVLRQLDSIEWDAGTEHFPPTSFQIAQVHAGEADNVIPGELKAHFNLRYNDSHSFASITKRIETLLDENDNEYTIRWHHSGAPFLTTPDNALIKATQTAIKEVQGIETELSTGGGTSDGRFIAPSGAQVVELGLRNFSIHKINEQVAVADLDTLQQLYHAILIQL